MPHIYRLRRRYNHYRGVTHNRIYAAFSYSAKEQHVINEYINKQKEHHHKKNIKEEYEELMRASGLDPSKDLFLLD